MGPFPAKSQHISRKCAVMTVWHLIWTGNYTKTAAISKVLNGEIRTCENQFRPLGQDTAAHNRVADYGGFCRSMWRIVADFVAV